MSGGKLTLLQDLANDDSDKTFTLASGVYYEVLYGSVELITTATVGNRQIVIEIDDSAGETIYRLHAGAVQAASLTRHYLLGQGNVREGSFVDGTIDIPLPDNLFVPPGGNIRVYDSAAVAAAADDMDVSIMVRELPINHEDVT